MNHIFAIGLLPLPAVELPNNPTTSSYEADQQNTH